MTAGNFAYRMSCHAGLWIPWEQETVLLRGFWPQGWKGCRWRRVWNPAQKMRPPWSHIMEPGCNRKRRYRNRSCLQTWRRQTDAAVIPFFCVCQSAEQKRTSENQVSWPATYMCILVDVIRSFNEGSSGYFGTRFLYDHSGYLFPCWSYRKNQSDYRLELHNKTFRLIFYIIFLHMGKEKECKENYYSGKSFFSGKTRRTWYPLYFSHYIIPEIEALRNLL